MTSNYRYLVGVGGIGTGMFFALRGNATLGRNESRPAELLPHRDFCKLHIVAQYVAALTGGGARGFGVFPIGKVGADSAGAELVDLMRRAGMDTRFVATDPHRPTLLSACFSYPDGEGGNITSDNSAASALTAQEVETCLSALVAHAGPAGGVAVAMPEAPLEARLALLARARRHSWLTAAAVNSQEMPQALARGLPALVDVLGLNRHESAAVCGRNANDDPLALTRWAGEALARWNPRIRLCVTAGALGAFGWENGQVECTPPPPVAAVATAGAGDATLAGLIVALTAGLPFILPNRPRRHKLTDEPLATAMDFAALLAGLAVASHDTINFAAGPAAIAELAGRIGADIAALALALNWRNA